MKRPCGVVIMWESCLDQRGKRKCMLSCTTFWIRKSFMKQVSEVVCDQNECCKSLEKVNI